MLQSVSTDLATAKYSPSSRLFARQSRKKAAFAALGTGGSYRCDGSLHGQGALVPEIAWEHSYTEGEFLIKPIASVITAITRITAPA
jgi:hypothetical protein